MKSTDNQPVQLVVRTERNPKVMRLANLTQIVNEQQSQDLERAIKLEQSRKLSQQFYRPEDDLQMAEMM